MSLFIPQQIDSLGVDLYTIGEDMRARDYAFQIFGERKLQRVFERKTEPEANLPYYPLVPPEPATKIEDGASQMSGTSCWVLGQCR